MVHVEWNNAHTDIEVGRASWEPCLCHRSTPQARGLSLGVRIMASVTNDNGRWRVAVRLPNGCSEEAARRVAKSIARFEQAVVGDSLDSLLDGFGLTLKARGDTQEHIDRTLRMCRSLFLYGDIAAVADLTANNIEEGQESVRTAKGLSAQSVGHYYAALRSFCRWLLDRGHVEKDPMAAMRAPKVAANGQNGRALTQEEVRRLIDGTATLAERCNLAGPARALLYETAIVTGLRARELASLKLADLDTVRLVIQLPGKNAKNRSAATVPVSRSLVDRILANPSDGHLVGVPSRAAEVLRADMKALGMDPTGMTFHSLRHTFVSLLIQSGADPRVVQSLARHSDPRMTLGRYAHNGLAAEAEAVAKAFREGNGGRT
jgi:site-specific recombinase XerD